MRLIKKKMISPCTKNDLLISVTVWGSTTVKIVHVIRIVAKFLDFIFLEDNIVSLTDIKTHNFFKF
jgi:hypothetical protein